MEEIGSLRRVRRQTAPSCSNQWDESQCEAAILVSTTANKIDICTETYMLENCCGTCAGLSAQGVLPEGKRDLTGGLLAKLSDATLNIKRYFGWD